MARAILFDLFETLITESRTRPLVCPRWVPSLGVSGRLSMGNGERFVPL
jgi:hypothetical protein